MSEPQIDEEARKAAREFLSQGGIYTPIDSVESELCQIISRHYAPKIEALEKEIARLKAVFESEKLSPIGQLWIERDKLEKDRDNWQELASEMEPQIKHNSYCKAFDGLPCICSYESLVTRFNELKG